MAINSLSTGWRPGVCTSGTRPTAPYEGQQIYETDTDKTLVWSGSAWLYLSTPQTTEIGAWASFTPAWSGITVGNGTNTGVYALQNKMLFVKTKFVMGSTSAMTGFPTFTLPASSVATTTNQLVFGVAGSDDVGSGLYISSCYLISSTTVRAYCALASGTYVSLANITNTVPFTWATGDVLYTDFVLQVN
jgi:hypothetical protein